MNPKKTFKDRLFDLSLNYGGVNELADSLNMPVSTLRGWLKRDTPPSGIESYLEEKTGNPKAISRRERYFSEEKVKYRYEHREKGIDSVEAFSETKGIIKRPVEVFDFRNFGYEIGSEIENFKLHREKGYRITIDVFDAEEVSSFEFTVPLSGNDLDNLESVAWSWARRVEGIAGSQVALTITGIEEV